MIAKSLIAAAAIAATMAVALPAQEAKADVDVSIGIGVGGFHPGYGYNDYDYDYDADFDAGYGDGYGYGYDYPVHKPYSNKISCNKGRRIVDNSGFNKVKAVDCSLPGYRYTAWKKGRKYMVRMNGRGNITGVSKIF
jgi:hypothetical protein